NISPNPRSWVGVSATSWPSHVIVPVEASSPATARRSEDLPHPEGPSSARISPSATVRFASRTAGRAAPGYWICTSVRVSMLELPCAFAAEPFAGSHDGSGEDGEDDGGGQRHPVVVGAGPGNESENHRGQRRLIRAGEETRRPELSQGCGEGEPDRESEGADEERAVDAGEHRPRTRPQDARGLAHARVDRPQHGGDRADDERDRDDGLRD